MLLLVVVLTWLVVPRIHNVVPTNGARAGVYYVTIFGESLGMNDLVNVTLCGFLCPVATWNSDTQITVVAPQAAVNGTGNVTLVSLANGVGTLENGFRFNPGMLVLLLVVF